jgi:hypothetical protein
MNPMDTNRGEEEAVVLLLQQHKHNTIPFSLFEVIYLSSVK